ncbi:MAG: glycosyl hydrolase [Planctomycetes bacterium]|nr:glycosyl hydrolase [Planctomycetota bacterium]
MVTRESAAARVLLLLGALFLAPAALQGAAQESVAEEKKEDLLSSATFSALKLRALGPALSSGRVGDFAVDPERPARCFAAVCSGGVWKTENAGTTWQPVFDEQGSYSIGCVALDPQNPNVVWVGTGENNSQRSVGFGDGVYKSLDGGKSWKNVGLKESEHIGMIVPHPSEPGVVYVAAQGPLWRSGGERGLYRTADGGGTWERILHISDDTGVSEVHLDPRDPKVLYACAYQRRRHVWTLIDGGPESGLHKSEDGGKSWRKITSGLPGVDLGRIGLDVSPANADVLYAIVEATDAEGGVFVSLDRGETWEKRSSYTVVSPQYYCELICDPRDAERCYSMDTLLHVTEDGGRTWNVMPRADRHVDDHALWIDPEDTNHLLVGCDGGIYETFDRGAAWDFKENLPVTQFYRVAADSSEPFYFVYGGTQDNNTIGGPSRTRCAAGIASEEWFVTVGGDGFEPAVDPFDPNIVYSQWQHGGLVRYDRRTGEQADIKPREAPNEPPLKWNWDSPLLISPHAPERLYFGANILFRSDDRGGSWRAVSGDMSRGIDRNQLEVMGRKQKADAVAKHRSTSIYGNIVALDESPLQEGLLYAGTDDGLVHVSGDSGAAWEKIESFPGVPDMTYVSCLKASRHHADTVFAAFDNHKLGDFKPYLLKSADRGHTWDSIAGDLPERNIVYSVALDHERPELLFAGTEFGLFFTLDGGKKWIQLKSGLPTIAVRDLEVQRRENDLVLATFGRGIYVLDDYSPLRQASEETFQQGALLFPVKDALQYVETSRLGGDGRGSQGATFFTAPNPPFGATFTYYLKEKVMSRKERRKEAESEADKAVAEAKKKAEEAQAKAGESQAEAEEAKPAETQEEAGEAKAGEEAVAAKEEESGAAATEGQPARYPTIDELRAEDRESEPGIMLTIRDAAGDVVRRINGPRDKGLHRVSWDLRFAGANPIAIGADGGGGPPVPPGEYQVTLSRQVDGVVTDLAGPESFAVLALEPAAPAGAERAEIVAFRLRARRLQRAATGAVHLAGETAERVKHLKAAFLATPGADPALLVRAHEIERRLQDIQTELSGDSTLIEREEPVPLSISARIDNVVSNQWSTTAPPTQTERDACRYAGEALERVLLGLRALIEQDIKQLEADLEAAGAPWTPGRIPEWKAE